MKVASTKSLTPYELGASEETYYGMINTQVSQSFSQSNMAGNHWVLQVRTASSRSYDNLLESLTRRQGEDNHSAETQRMVDSRSGSGAQTSEVSEVLAL